MAHRFEIGTQYLSSGKHPRLCTVDDLMTVTNSKGEVVKRFYVTSHEFMGQKITDRDVCETTIARGVWELQHAGKGKSK